MKCGLLGRKLSHSYSPAIHAQLGDYEYGLFEKEPEQVASFLHQGNWDGLNVTVPYKQTVIPYLDELDPIAAKLGAVNTILRRNGKLIGLNTDFGAFRAMVVKSCLSPAGKKCLVLGSGGASKVAVAVMEDLGAEVIVISRKGENHYQNLHRHQDAAIIVNTTPVGMYPNTGVSLVDLELFPRLEGVLDVIYNPARTQLLMDAEQRGIVAMNGLWMLIVQAQEASCMMTGHAVSNETAEQTYAVMRQRMENIVLIGMPGCGKSTVGRLLAEKLGKTFLDTDAEIEKMANKTIPQIFTEDGEAHFRVLETKVLAEFGKQSGLVIATGGGCVTQAHNYPLLHQNGRIFWLQRDLDKLATKGRPLSVDLEGLYRDRQKQYEAFADCIVHNNSALQETAASILADWEDLS